MDAASRGLGMSLIEPGAKAPLWSLPDRHGDLVALKSFTGQFVILYFYPKADTSVCANQACTFRDALPKFRRAGAAVVGISPDSVETLGTFAKKHRLNFPLLSDTPANSDAPPTCAAYGTWQKKSMYGRPYMGVVRTTYLIAPDGKVARRWDKVRVAGHAEVLYDLIRTAAKNADTR